jgi:hypothetical protein
MIWLHAPPPPASKLDRRHRPRKKDDLRTAEGGGRGAESYDRKKTWSFKSFNTQSPPSSLFVFLLSLLVGGGGVDLNHWRSKSWYPSHSFTPESTKSTFRDAVSYVLGESVLAHPGQDQRGILQELQPAQPHQAGIEPAAACPSLIFSTSNICLLVLQKISLLCVLGGTVHHTLEAK